MASKNNRYREAFRENGNLIGIAGAVALAAATLNPLPLLGGLIGEVAYLLFVPDSRWYETRISRRIDAAEAARREQTKAETFALLETPMQVRFSRLEEIRAQIDTQAQNDQTWFREVLRQLDYLLEKFLLFARKETQFREYLGSVWQDECGGASTTPHRLTSAGPSTPVLPSSSRIPTLVTDIQASYDREIVGLQKNQMSEPDGNTKAVLTKRIEVLQQRREGVGKIGRIVVNLQNQLALLEDTFGLINDQIRARSPEQVLADIEGVVTQTDSMTQLLDELAPYQQITA